MPTTNPSVVVPIRAVPPNTSRRPSSHVKGQLALLIALQVLAAVVLGGPFMVTEVLANDRFVYYPLFRDTLHALNVHGEVPWWNPAVHGGFPFYYMEMLTWPGRGPMFSAVAATVWALGRLGIVIDSYFPLYMFHFALLTPLLVNLGILALARQILRHPLAVYAVIILIAFSPGVIYSFSDVDIKLTFYGFLFAALLLRFLKQPTRLRFVVMSLPLLGMATSLSFLGLFWNVFFVPGFALLVSLGPRGLTARARHGYGAITPAYWGALAFGLFLCVMPTVVVYQQGDGIHTARTGEDLYAYKNLRPGNPLEFLALSSPAVGFEWTNYVSPDGRFEPRPKELGGRFSSYGYLGMVTLPLVGLGLALGRRYWSVRLYGCLVAGVAILMLSGYSPLFSLLLGWQSPFRAVNHYSDTSFRQGIYALCVLAAGLGVEAILRPSRWRRWLLTGLFGVTATASLVWLTYLHPGTASRNYLFGLAAALAFFYVIALARLAAATSARRVRAALVVILGLLLIDTSAFAFAHQRIFWAQFALGIEDITPAEIGTPRGMFAEGKVLFLDGIDATRLAADRRAAPAVVLHAGTGAPLQGSSAEMIAQTYNTAAIRVVAAEDGRLEWRDAYFPFWRASVNGIEVPVERTPSGAKAVRVPGGASDVTFRFSPPGVPIWLAIGYVPLAVAGLMAVVLCVRDRSRPRSA